jgi:hypothetical protein
VRATREILLFAQDDGKEIMLRLEAFHQSWEWDCFADVVDSAEPAGHALDAHPEAGMGD